jgi:hypothetical protein
MLAPNDVVGLSALVLLDSTPYLLTESPEWSGKDYENGCPVYGWYVQESPDTPSPYIVLNVHHVYRYIPAFLRWSKLPALRILHCLSHEVAHHIRAKKGYIFQADEQSNKEEELASKYARDTVNQIVRLNWSYRVAHWLSKEIAFWHYTQGILDFKQCNFFSSASHFQAAWELFPDLPNVSTYYWQARQAHEASSGNDARTNLQSNS